MQSVTVDDSKAGIVAELYCVLADPVPGDVKQGIEHRRAKRQQVLKRAQIVFGFSDSVIDCLIMDETRYGVLLETSVMTAVPERVKLRFVGGATFDALRRWSTGNKIGLEFVGSQIYDEVTLQRMRLIDNVLKQQGLHPAVSMLRDSKFFGNGELEKAAEDAEIALARLESLLA